MQIKGRQIKDARHLALHLVNESCRKRGPNSPAMSFVRLWNMTKLNKNGRRESFLTCIKVGPA